MKKKVIIIAAAILLAAICIIGICIAVKNANKAEIKEKSINLTIIYPKGNSREIPITTPDKYLADALLDAGIILESEYESGNYTVIDGVSTNYEMDASWWCLSINGKTTTDSMNEIIISDGAEYTLEYTVG